MSKKNDVNRLYKVGENIIKYLIFAFVVLIAIIAILFKAEANNMHEQVMIISWDNPLISILMPIGIAVVAGLIAYLLADKTRYGIRGLIIFTCVFYFIVGTDMILRGRCAPGADAGTVVSMADSVSRGSLAIIDGEASYLSYYPQQIGLTLLLAPFMWLIHLLPISIAEFHLLKFLYLIMICIATVFQYKIVCKLWDNKRVSAVFLVLSCINLPYILYSNFIYSEIPAFCLFSVGLYFYIELFEDKTKLKFVLSILFLALSVFIRKNSIVLVIAVLITSLLYAIRERKWYWIVYDALLAICSVGFQPLVLGILELIVGRQVYSGVTAMSYLAMGMQEVENSRGAGWYTGYNFNTYVEAGFDSKIANEISKAYIADRWQHFCSNPSEMFGFYWRKIASQWTDGTYAALQATQATGSDRSAFWVNLYFGSLRYKFDAFCNALQSVVFAGTLGFMIAANKAKQEFYKYVMLFGAFGGFLFHILWEANSRYIFTYGLLLIPYAAFGINEVIKLVDKRKKSE